MELEAHSVPQSMHIATGGSGSADGRRITGLVEEVANTLLQIPSPGTGLRPGIPPNSGRNPTREWAVAKGSMGGPTQNVRVQSANHRPLGNRSTTRDSPERKTLWSDPILWGTAPSSPGAMMLPAGWSRPCRQSRRAISRRKSPTVRGRPPTNAGVHPRIPLGAESQPRDGRPRKCLRATVRRPSKSSALFRLRCRFNHGSPGWIVQPSACRRLQQELSQPADREPARPWPVDPGPAHINATPATARWPKPRRAWHHRGSSAECRAVPVSATASRFLQPLAVPWERNNPAEGTLELG